MGRILLYIVSFHLRDCLLYYTCLASCASGGFLAFRLSRQAALLIAPFPNLPETPGSCDGDICLYVCVCVYICVFGCLSEERQRVLGKFGQSAETEINKSRGGRYLVL